MAEYVVVPEHIICKLPEAMSLEHAAMIEPVSIAVHAVNRAAPRIGSSALVIGCGIIGQFTVQAARLAGCGTVVAVDLDQGRLDMAKRLGADLIVNSADADWKDIARKAAGRDGFDYVFEAVGLEVTVQAALDLVRRGGRTVLIGNVSPSIQVPLQRIVTGEIDVLGSCASAGEYATCVELVSRGQIRVAELISRTAPLSDGEHWFKELHGPRSDGGKEPLFKIILQP
jgi:L-iditol 2-dehydrogenase